MSLEDLLKDPNTALWAGFISAGIFYALYFTTLKFGPKVYRYLFVDEKAHLPAGEYEEIIRTHLEQYRVMNEKRIKDTKNDNNRKNPD